MTRHDHGVARTIVQRSAEHLQRIEWPATRSSLLECASQSGAPHELLAELCTLPDDDIIYRDVSAVVNRVRLMRILSANF
jgi:hypothetical protein